LLYVKLIFPLINILKVIFRQKLFFTLTNIFNIIFWHVQSQLLLWQTYSKSYLVMSKVNFSFDKHTQSYIWKCLKSTFFLDKHTQSRIWTYLKSTKLYLDMSKVNFSFHKHSQSHIWTCPKSTFPLVNILKVIFTQTRIWSCLK
jgi:hypothetical protein